MKKVLIITYHFPPEGGPAVQRVTKFVKYLNHFGYMPIVLAASGKIKVQDPTLLDDIPSEIKIHRTIDPGRYMRGKLKKIFKKSFVPDKFNLWRKTAVKKAIQLIRDDKIDVIFSTSPPHSVQLIAREVAESSGVPWVADFRDEWINDPSYSSRKSSSTHRKLEKQVIEKCDHLVTITRAAKNHFADKTDADKITYLPNGYDPDDFQNKRFKEEDSDNKLLISYCGRLNRTHSPEPLFLSLNDLLLQNKIAADQFEINIYGNIDNRKYLKDFPGLAECVHFKPYQPHANCISELAKSNILLLLATKMDWTQFLPAKMFEYFFLRKPILAIISSKGELYDTLQKYGPVYFGFENDPDSISQVIIDIWNEWHHGSLKNNVDEAHILQFDRRDQTRALSEIFNKVLADDHPA